MSSYSQQRALDAETDLLLASLPGAAGGQRVAVLGGSHAETVARSQGYDVITVRSVALVPGMLLAGEADCWLEGAGELAMVEMITGLSFKRDALPDSAEERLRQAWRAARTGSQLKALYRAAGIFSIVSED